jgi:hypothetical protein
MEESKHVSYVPAVTSMREFSIKALLIGLVMCVVLGAANAYLGLRAGMTIAATYPAAVIGMAVLRLFKGSILEENYARTVGSIGESVAAGAIFTLPAFLIAGVWKEFWSPQHYFEASAILLVGGILGILFVTILRRVMVEDKELPFPESVAASEIHKAGQGGQTGAKFLFGAMGLGAIIQGLKSLNVFASSWERFVPFAGKEITFANKAWVKAGGGALITTPGREPGLHGGRLHHRAQARGPQLHRRPAGLGPVRAAAPLLPRPPARGLAAGHGRGPRRARHLGRHGQPGVAQHRPPDRHRRHVDERGLHAVPHAQEPGLGPVARGG